MLRSERAMMQNERMDDLEAQNRRAAEDLAKKVAFYKGLAKDINKEARDHIPLIGGLDDEMEGTGNLLSNSLGRVRGLLGSNRSNRRIMCYIAAGMVMFVVFTYLIYALAGNPEA
ncbi:hypothetical protein QYM36_001419 [Artemia franciscana]|uniref:BET1-like protein n=1 Tax=Artemia franciscana TaxID=6661 RepID=A0AA88ID31_ARTSF|nr:hypothetical protein QYM36_001419 [Artemia franciscana]